jgi:hypothetical protein
LVKVIPPVTTYTVDNTKLIEISVPVVRHVTSAKVMVWSDLKNALPIEKAKIFEVK